MGRSALLPAALLLALGMARAELVRDGEELALRLETPHPYGEASSAEPGIVWSRPVLHPGASYIQVHFARFELAPGDRVVVRSPDGRQAWSYEGLGRGSLGLDPDGFWSSRILGEAAIVELHAAQRGEAFGFAIDRMVRGLTAVELIEVNDVDPTSICGGDDSEWAKCYETSEPQIYERSRAVVRLHLPGTSCTGWLLGCEGHLVTNHHCIESANVALNTDYEFMAEGATCATPCFDLAACSGPIEATTATLIATNAALDYTLVKLPTNVSETYGFFTLREGGAVLDERIYIPGHPSGWGKRIAVFSSHPTDASGFCEVASLNATACTGGPGDIGYFCDTQGGSSGSPVVAYADHKVVSLHHCGTCPNRGLDITDVVASLGASLPECSLEQLAGTIEVDRPIYSCADEIFITVKDDSLKGAGEQTVSLTSTSEPAGESVLLVEDQPGLFRGSFPTSAVAPATGDGQLALADGDTITALYIDADDGQGGVDIPREDEALADCAGPAIVAVTTTDISTIGATVSWQTDEPASGYVAYGVTPPGSSTVADPVVGTTHGVSLSGLDECQKYFYSVTSTDELGNVATNDNGGASFSFTTLCFPPKPIPDGSLGSEPITVERLEVDGGTLLVHWDDQCTPYQANLIYGPLAQVSAYVVSGGVCTVTEPATWGGVPPGDLWFVLVGESKDHKESSWGMATSGQRAGLFSSGQCGVTFKNPLGVCP